MQPSGLGTRPRGALLLVSRVPAQGRTDVSINFEYNVWMLIWLYVAR